MWNENFELSRLMGVTRDMVRKARQRELDKIGIHYDRSAVLFMINYLGIKATPFKISEHLIRKRHTLSELIIRMEKDGLVLRIHDFRKNNMVRVILTQKGNEKLIESSKRESIKNIFNALTADEQVQLESLLTKVRDQALKDMNLVRTVPYMPTDDKTFRLFGLLIETVEIIRQARQRELDQHGLKTYQSAVLITIQMMGERATPSAIARKLIRSRSTLSEILANMKKNGLVILSHDINKKNGLKVTLTKDGYEQYLNALEGKALDYVFSVLSKQQHKLLYSYLQRLLTKASEELKK